MKRYLLACVFALLPLPALAADVENGRQLHDAHCMACHDSGVYTRDDRRITTLAALGEQVRRCEFNLELQWFDDDVNDVIEHLNASFYQFK